MDGRPGDAELVHAAVAGDRAAFATIYDRYADRLHDFRYSLLRDREEAADATQDAFVTAAERLGQLRDPERLRPWLYAVARSQALARLRARRRTVTESEVSDMPDPAGGAAGLARPGEAMGVGAGHAYVLLSRLRDQVERSLGALLVARLGRDDCPELRRLLTGWDGRFSPLIRKRVARHVDECDLCAERRRVVASPLSLLAAVPLSPAPPELRDRVLQRIQLTGGRGGDDGPGESGPGGGIRAAASRLRGWTLAAALLGVAVLLAVVTGGVLLARGGHPGDPEPPDVTAAAAAPAGSSGAGGASGSTAPPPGAPPPP